MSRYIDLHTHSQASDGTLSPAALACAAVDAGLSAFALTDHDAVSGLDEGMTAAARAGAECVPGVELSAQSRGELHILGLFVKPDCAALSSTLHRLALTRENRNRAMVDKLRELGVDIDYDRLRECGAVSVTRAHMARLLRDKGYCDSIGDAFDKYLSVGAPAYVPRVRLSARECIDLVHAAGGLAVIAHPHTVALDGGSIADFLKDMRTLGADAVECLYHCYDREQTDYLTDTARRLGMEVSGGSDFHGDNKPNRLGQTGAGPIEYDVLERLRERHEVMKW